eukprot:SAG22_NODE_477_length_9978_cov_2.807268_13_plen_246_part_00
MSLEWDDRLRVFEEVVQVLEKEHDAARAQEKKLQRRQERKCRDAFRALLAEQTKAGEITALSTWTEFIAREGGKNATAPAYLAMEGHGGSAACELFDDVVEELEAEVQVQVASAEKALEGSGKTLTEATTAQELAEWLSAAALPFEVTAVLHAALIRAKQRWATQSTVYCLLSVCLSQPRTPFAAGSITNMPVHIVPWVVHHLVEPGRPGPLSGSGARSRTSLPTCSETTLTTRRSRPIRSGGWR